VFTEHTHIVAVRTTGNVYCYEALEELCLKPKNLRDLLTGAGRVLRVLINCNSIVCFDQLHPKMWPDAEAAWNLLAFLFFLGRPTPAASCACAALASMLILRWRCARDVQTSPSPAKTSSTCKTR
jgi:hypothetical protein